MHFIGNLPNKRYRCYSHNRIPDKVRDPGRFSARSHRRIWHLHNWSRWLSRRSSCLRSLRSWTDSRNLHVPVLSYCISMYLHHMIILCTILCTIIYVCVNVWVTGCSLSLFLKGLFFSILNYDLLWSIMIYLFQWICTTLSKSVWFPSNSHGMAEMPCAWEVSEGSDVFCRFCSGTKPGSGSLPVACEESSRPSKVYNHSIM